MKSMTLTPGEGVTSPNPARKIANKALSQWLPEHDYEEVDIGHLSPGPRRISFTGRVVNIYDQAIESKTPQSAKGCLKVLVKDESATILIKLWYTSTSYDLRLGTLLTCWTTHIHSTSSLPGVKESLVLPSAPIMTSIFPERDYSCHIQIHNDGGKLIACCRIPIGYCGGDPLPGLTSLHRYIHGGGSDLPEARLIVCVLAIGDPTTITTKTGTTFVTLDIGICDQSSQATLSLCRPLFTSVRLWIKTKTVLLLSFPKLCAGGRISTTSRSHIDVDPDIDEAVALRRFVQRENCPINQPFPENIFNIEATESSPTRLQFTFATLAEFVDAEPDQIISGYISVILSEVNLMYLLIRKQLFSMECCGMPIYANEATGECGQCGDRVGLKVNPNLIGSMADETGAVGCHDIAIAFTRPSYKNSVKKRHSKVLWRNEAWCQLLGRSAEELAAFCREDVSSKTRKENIDVLRYLEQRLQWMRVVLLVGWTGNSKGGRLAVLKVVE